MKILTKQIYINQIYINENELIKSLLKYIYSYILI